MGGERRSRQAAGEAPVQVRVPDRPPVVYPQAARVLRRIVVRLAKMERLAEDVGGAEEAS
ncbi:MAG: hypothetical protein QOH03_4070 [Kribbellaceae bacterium]|jgi:hypothetical protein|nr:hypothetical protein [Kribbellaceae bacterium]